MSDEVNAFVRGQRLVMDELNKFKSQLKQIVPLKQAEVTFYKSFATFLERYEIEKDKAAGQGSGN